MKDGNAIEFKTFSVFKSRLTLNYQDSSLELKYAQSAENKKENSLIYNILICGLISLFGIVNISTNNLYKERKSFLILNSIFLFLNCFSNLLALLSTRVSFLKFRKNKMEFFLNFINFYTIEMDFFCTIWYEPNLGHNYEFTMFIIAVSSSVKFIYIIIIKKNYIPSLSSFFSLVITQTTIVICYNPWKSIYVFFANLLILFSCIICSFLIELNMRVNFFILHSVIKKNIQANITDVSNNCSRNMSVAFDKNFSLSNMNFQMINYLQNIKNVKKKENPLDTEKILRMPSNILGSYWKNKVSRSLISSESFDENLKEIVEELFSQLIVINEQLSFKNKKIYEYLLKFKFPNLSEIKVKFDLDEFFQLVNDTCIRQKADSVINIDTNLNQSIAVNNTIVHTKESANLLENKQNLLNFNLLTRRRKSRTMLNENEYICLGKIMLESLNKQSSSSMSEYYLFFSVLAENQGFCFTIEDLSEIISHEREETAKICKSLYLSKISHEFKNPISNLIEITNLLEDESTHKISNNNFPKRRSSKEIKYKTRNSINSEDDSSVEMSFAVSKIDKKTLRLDMFQRNTTFLKITSEMMLQLVKDFTFFSHNLDDSDPDIFNNMSSIRGEAVSNIQDSTFHNINSSNILRMKPTFILSCNYREILSHTINIFNVKTEMENKVDKVSIETKYEPMLPTIIEYDSEKFRSLVFNLIYHIFKSTNSGKIKINVSRGIKNSNVNILIFDFNVNGLCARKNLENDLISERDDESNSKYEDQIIDKEIKEPAILSQNSKFNNQNLPFIEKFHIKNIINASSLQERNIIIDNFNNNFHFYLANIYSKKMGLKLKINNINKKSYSISFEVEINTILSQKKFSNMYLSQKKTGSSFDPIEKEIGISRKDSANIKKIGPSLNKINSVEPDRKTKLRRNTVSFTNIPKFNQNSEEFQTYISSNNPNDEIKTRRTNFPSNFYYPYYITNNINVREIVMKNMNLENSSIASMSNFENEINNYEKFLKQNYLQTSKKIEILSENSSNPTKKRRSQSFHPNMIENLENKLINNLKPKIFHNPTLMTKKTLNNSSINLTPEIEESSKSINDFIKVLICDDESLIRKNLHRFFNLIAESDANLNFDVKHAENGFECIAQIYDYYRQNKNFDVLIIDETMPFMKGSQVIHLLKSMVREDNFKDIVIVSFTSYDSPEKKEYIYSQGADYVLSKPMKYDDFKNFFNFNLRKNSKLIL